MMVMTLIVGVNFCYKSCHILFSDNSQSLFLNAFVLCISVVVVTTEHPPA